MPCRGGNYTRALTDYPATANFISSPDGTSGSYKMGFTGCTASGQTKCHVSLDAFPYGSIDHFNDQPWPDAGASINVTASQEVTTHNGARGGAFLCIDAFNSASGNTIEDCGATWGQGFNKAGIVQPCTNPIGYGAGGGQAWGIMGTSSPFFTATGDSYNDDTTNLNVWHTYGMTVSWSQFQTILQGCNLATSANETPSNWRLVMIERGFETNTSGDITIHDGVLRESAKEFTGQQSPPGTSPSAFEDSSGNTFVYYRGTDGTLWSWYRKKGGTWTNWQVQWAGQSNEPVKSGTSPSAFEDSAGNTFVYYTGADGHLWTWYLKAGGTWTNWQVQWAGQSNEAVMAGTSPSSFEDRAGNTFVYYTGADGHLWVWYIAGGTWTNWPVQWAGQSNEPVKSGTSPSAYEDSGGNTFVYYTGADGTLWVWYITVGATWTNWQVHWAGQSNEPVQPGGSPSAYEDPGGNTFVYYTGADSTLWTWYARVGGTWANWQVHWAGQPNEPVASGTRPSPFEDSAGNTFVYYTGADNTLWTWYLKVGGTWTNWEVQTQTQGNDPVLPGTSPSAFEDSSGNTFVYYIGNDAPWAAYGALWSWNILAGSPWQNVSLG
jgi:hypothetical protein